MTSKNLIELIIIVALSGWLFYKFYKTGKSMHLFLAVLIPCLQFKQWPLFLPQKLILTIIAIFCSLLSLHRYYKNRKENLYLGLGLILFLFSVSFATDMLFSKKSPKTIAVNNKENHRL